MISLHTYDLGIALRYWVDMNLEEINNFSVISVTEITNVPNNLPFLELQFVGRLPKFMSLLHLYFLIYINTYEKKLYLLL